MAELVEMTLTEMLRENSRKAYADGVRAGRAAALEEAAKVAKGYWATLAERDRNHGSIAATCNGIEAAIRALIEVKA